MDVFQVCLFEWMSGWMCLQGADWFQPKDGGGSYFQDKRTVPKAPAVLSPLATASRTSSRTQLMQPSVNCSFGNSPFLVGVGSISV